MSDKLYLGVDIGKQTNSISFYFQRKEVLKRKYFDNNIYGFIDIKNAVDDLLVKYNLSCDDCIMGVESTGHYWKNLAYFFESNDINVVMVGTKAVKSMRELTYAKGKNDSVDSKAIAQCLESGNYFDIRKNDKYYLILKRLTRSRDDFAKSLAQVKNRINAWLDVNNQSYYRHFKDIDSKTGFSLIREYPSPSDVVDISVDEVIENIKKHMTRVSKKRITLYVEECKELSCYKNSITDAEIIEIQYYIKQYDMFENALQELEKKIIEFAKENLPVYSKLENMAGMPNIFLISMLAEIGNVDTFNTARHLLSYCGLTLKTKQSGNIQGETRITKVGSRRIRKYLFLISTSLVTHNDSFRKLYCYYKSYNRKHLNKNKEMLIAVGCKFLRTLYGMIKNDTEFDENILLSYLDFENCDREKFIEEYNRERKSFNKDELICYFK